MVENYKEYIEETAEKTGFIRSILEKVERLLNILEWISNKEELKDLLALKGGTAINTAVFNFPRLSVDIDLDLTENLEKDEMKQAVREYLKDILVIDDNIQEFYDKFHKGIYEPELLFDDDEIIERIKFHPMINWKLKK